MRRFQISLSFLSIANKFSFNFNFIWKDAERNSKNSSDVLHFLELTCDWIIWINFKRITFPSLHRRCLKFFFYRHTSRQTFSALLFNLFWNSTTNGDGVRRCEKRAMEGRETELCWIVLFYASTFIWKWAYTLNMRECWWTHGKGLASVRRGKEFWLRNDGSGKWRMRERVMYESLIVLRSLSFSFSHQIEVARERKKNRKCVNILVSRQKSLSFVRPEPQKCYWGYVKSVKLHFRKS